MNLKKLALWLLVIGIVSLIIGGVVGVVTFDVEEFRSQKAEYKASFNLSNESNYDDWNWKKEKWEFFCNDLWKDN